MAALLFLWTALLCAGAAHAVYNVGVGVADMTGPPVEINFMGYADLAQSGRGIHLRQFSRAFIFELDGERFVLVSADVQALGIAVRRGVVSNLQDRYGELYSERNVILTGTHTHSTPGGYLVDFIYDVSILGFVRETFNAYVEGITESIMRAHEAMVPARVYLGQTEVDGISVNRSPFSYLQNPQVERARYDHNTDTMLTQLRIERDADGSLLGVLNWYAVHTVSMNMTNQLVSSDNLGYASVLMEKRLNPPGTLVGKGDIVCAFANSNEGDISPNTAGPRCEFSGDECDGQFLLCPGGAAEQCYAQGPGRDMFDSTRIIAETLVDAAMEVLEAPSEELEGPVGIVHQFVDMPEQVVPKYDPITQTFNPDELVGGCVPAMGYSFAAGTTDGANNLNITQGETSGLDWLDTIRDFLGEPTEEDHECHHPKPILLATGRSTFPLEWHPTVISVSVMRLGRLLLAGLPGEFTTMSGRRVRDAVGAAAAARGLAARVLLAGLANDYTHYITTFDEYQVQRYEGASTMYGPNTLDIYLNKFTELTAGLLENTGVEPGPQPIDNLDNTWTLVTPVVLDTSPFGREFGECVLQPERTYTRRGLVVHATFISGNPRNNLHHGDWYAAVEQQLEDGSWTVVATDADWETRFVWERLSSIAGTSQVHVYWEIPEGTPSGTYRIRHRGDSKPLIGAVRPYEGATEPFAVALSRCTPRAARVAAARRRPHHLNQIYANKRIRQRRVDL